MSKVQDLRVAFRDAKDPEALDRRNVRLDGSWSRDIYHRLTGQELPETMRNVERRHVDGVFALNGDRAFVFELDEQQHFNQHRATTLRCYPASLALGFDNVPSATRHMTQGRRPLQ